MQKGPTAVTAFIVSAVAIGLITAGSQAAERRALRLSVQQSGAIAGGQSKTFLIDVESGDYVVELDQKGVDLILTVSSPGYFGQTSVDSPLEDYGAEFLMTNALSAGTLDVTVTPRLRHAASGSYSLVVRPLELHSREFLAAMDLRTRAAANYKQGIAANLATAAEEYRLAAARWKAIDEKAEAARDLYCAAVLARLTGKPDTTLALKDEVLNLLRASNMSRREHDFLNHIALIHQTRGEFELAASLFQRVLSYRRQKNDTRGRAEARSNICLSDFLKGEIDSGIACYEKLVSESWFDHNDKVAAAAYTNVGRARALTGDPIQARQHYERAISIRRTIGDDRGQAQALNNLALLYSEVGEPMRALETHAAALEIFRRLGAKRWEGVSLHNISVAYDQLGEPELALEFLQQAAPLLRQAGDARALAAALDRQGTILASLEDIPGATNAHVEALGVAQKAGEKRRESIVLRSLASLAASGRDFQKARSYLAESLRLAREVGDLASEAAALGIAAEISQELGSSLQARKSLRDALALRERIGDRHGQVESLTRLAQLSLELGEYESARDGALAAVDLLESARSQIHSPELRSTYGASKRSTYETGIEATMGPPGARVDSQNAGLALNIVETGKARSLLDALSWVIPPAPPAEDAHLMERHQDLRWRLNLAMRQRLDQRTMQSSTTQPVVSGELAELIRKFDRVESEIVRRRPLRKSSPLNANGIQNLLDSKTALINYWIGEARSWAWYVTAETIGWLELPPRTIIEDLAVRAHSCLRDASENREVCPEAKKLSEFLLGPMASQLRAERLLIVPDGVLAYLPFGALPMPGHNGRGGLLLDRFEIAYVPSASILPALRTRRARRSASAKSVAVFADPIFSGAGPGTRGAAVWRAPPTDASNGDHVQRSFHESLPRLRWTRTEAEAALRLDPLRSVSFLGADATRRNVLTQDLSEFRIVHFATHGIIDTHRPRLSGLFFSSVDEEEEQTPFLSLADILGLELNADLVVLSACETALGRHIRGEGLVGLTHAFLRAGSSRVLATLWQVDDEATSALIAHFYRERREKPNRGMAAALRSAQQAVRSESRWQHPRFWAGFVLVGDW